MGRTTRCSGFRFLVDFCLFIGSNPIQAHRESWILLASESVSTSVSPMLVHQDSEPVTSSSRLSLGQYKLICRSGFAVLSDAAKIFIATTVALIAVNRNRRAACAHAVSERPTIADMAGVLVCRQQRAASLLIRGVQSRVGLLLMRSGGIVVSGLKKGKNFFKARMAECQRAVRCFGIGFDDKGCFCSLCCKGFSHVAV